MSGKTSDRRKAVALILPKAGTEERRHAGARPGHTLETMLLKRFPMELPRRATTMKAMMATKTIAIAYSSSPWPLARENP